MGGPFKRHRRKIEPALRKEFDTARREIAEFLTIACRNNPHLTQELIAERFNDYVKNWRVLYQITDGRKVPGHRRMNDYIEFGHFLREHRADAFGRLQQQMHGTRDYSGAEALAFFERAVLQINSESVNEALVRIQDIFPIMMHKSFDEAIRRLPQLMYLLFRHASTRDMVRAVRDYLSPAIKSLNGRTALPKPTCAALLAIIGCALNEGGAHAEAAVIFAKARPNLAKADDPEFGWAVSMVHRNEAHCHAWLHQRLLIDHSIQRAIDVDPSAANAISVANTTSETMMAIGLWNKAWDGINVQYSRVFNHLQENYDIETGALRPGKRPLARLHHEFGVLALGILSGHQNGNAIGREKLELGLRYAYALGHVRLGRRTKLNLKHSDPDIQYELQYLAAATVHLTLRPSEIEILKSFASLIEIR